MDFKELINNLDGWEDWKNNYNKFVPKFIEEAKNNLNYIDWDKDVFTEFFEKGGQSQCVASLKQGYFTNQEKELIKKNWATIAPSLKLIAENQDTPLFNEYDKLKAEIRKHTKLDRRAATNRIIASLQPKLLCTIVNEKNLQQLFNYLNKNIEGCSLKYEGGNWFKNSNTLWDYFKTQSSDTDYKEIITYPWEAFEYFRGGHHLQKIMI